MNGHPSILEVLDCTAKIAAILNCLLNVWKYVREARRGRNGSIDTDER